MKTHTNNFKNEIKKMGKQIDSKITYIVGSEEIELGNQELNSVTPHYEANILKSVMKELDIDSNEEIPVGTEINYKFGVLVEGSYEYLDFGNYIVKEVEKQEDLNSWLIKCADKMLYAMKPYEKLEILYPITIKDYLQAICNKLGLVFENAYGTFANYDKQIQHELYLSYNETTNDYTDDMGYTFRDVLDEIAQATGSTILINNDDKLEIRYIEPDEYEESTVEGNNSLYITNSQASENALSYSVDGLCSQDGTPTPDNPVEVKTIPSIKNLFNGVYKKYNYSSGLPYSETTNITINSSDGNNINFTLNANLYIYVLTDTIQLEPNTQYTISFTRTDTGGSGSNRNRNYVYSVDNSTYAAIAGTPKNVTGNVSITFTTTSTGKVAFAWGSNNSSNGQVIDIKNIQLEEGTVAHDYVPYGYWSKVKVTGKNLCPTDFSNWESGDYSGTGAKSDNTARIRLRQLLRVNPSTTYYLNVFSSNDRFGLRTYDNSMNFVRSIGGIANESTITTNNNEYYLGIFIYSNTNQSRSYETYRTMFSNGDIKPLICLNSETDRSYEPYKENQVLIDMSKENLFDNSTLGWVRNNNGNYAITTNDNTTRIRTQNLLQLEGGKTYTISGYPSSVTLNIVKFYANIGDTNQTSYVSTSTFTVPTNATYVIFQFGGSNFTDETNTLMANADITLFEGNSPTPYYELCKIGDYKDTLSIDSSGNVVLNKNTGKIISNGSEDWITWEAASAGNTRLFGTSNYDGILNTLSYPIIYSNYFTGSRNSIWGIDDELLAVSNTGNQRLRLRLNKSTANTSTALKTWLSTHNTEIYYPLATPETINLPNTKIPLFEGINHITFVDDLETNTSITYTTQTLITEDIDEEYLQDININFGEKYGKVNSIVLSRAGNSDKVYLRDEESITENGLCEINISENQIMNWNDRSDYLPDLLEKLDGLEYYLNDFTSTGITYLDPCDKYYVHIGENTYPCIMFNDEINVTQGLQEIIHTDMPEQSETDYTKADKTDRKINQTTLIVDKQNQIIQSVISNVSEQDEKISQITQTVNQIESQIVDIPTITAENEGTGSLYLNNLAGTKLIQLKIHPTDTDIIGLFASNLLKVASGLKAKSMGVTFDNTDGTENDLYYKLPDNLYYYDSDTYDEFVYDGKEEKIYVIRKVSVDGQGNKSMLDTPITEEYEYQDLVIEAGDYNVFMSTYPTAYIYIKAMIKNDYTDLFATSYEVDSKITQTANAIQLEVNEKVDENEIIAKLNVAVENHQGIIELIGNTVVIDSDKFKLTADGDITANSGLLGDIMIKNGEIFIPITVDYDYTSADEQRVRSILAGLITPTQEDYLKYDLDNDNEITILDLIIIDNLVRFGITTTNPGKIIFKADKINSRIAVIGGNNKEYANIGFFGIKLNSEDGKIINITPQSVSISSNNDKTTITAGQIVLTDGTNTKTITATS